MIFLVVFTIECIVKIIALGFFLDNNSYLRDGWNWLDFFVVLTGIINIVYIYLFGGDDEGSGLGILRLFRILRPLRSLS